MYNTNTDMERFSYGKTKNNIVLEKPLNLINGELYFNFWYVKSVYMIRLKLVYRIEINGLENVPKDNNYIVCPNHLSTLDPPLMVAVMPRSVAFMAKRTI